MSDARRIVFTGTQRPSDYAPAVGFMQSCPKCMRIYRSESAYHHHVMKCSPVPEEFNQWRKSRR